MKFKSILPEFIYLCVQCNNRYYGKRNLDSYMSILLNSRFYNIKLAHGYFVVR